MGHLSEHGAIVEAFWLGRDPKLRTSVREVSAWLRDMSLEGGWIRTERHRQLVAYWLILTREHVERRQLGWG